MKHSTFRKDVISGIYWSVIESFGKSVFRGIIGLVLARLLEPSDFGLIGMIFIFISLSGVLIESGLSTALIQNSNLENKDFSTVFFFNVGAGIFIYFILFLIAPLIAIFFEQPLLIIIVRVVALNFVFSSFGLVQNSIFSKQMKFKVITKISLIAIFISGSASIIMALLDFGVWSLIVQILSLAFITSLLLWFFSEWKPTLEFDINSLKRLYKFGSKLMYANIINTVFQNIYLIVIGKIYTTRQLGFYTKAEGLAKLPVQNISGIFQKVFLPAFSQIQNDNIKLKSAYKRILIVSGFVVFPVMLGLIPIAKPFILFILTDKWSGSIPFLQLLCLTYLFYPFHSLNINILNIKGRSDLVLKLEYLKKGIIILALIVTFKIGIMALIIGQLASSVIAIFINARYSGELINYPVSEQLKDLLPYLLLSVGTTLFLFIPTVILGDNYLFQLLIQLSFGSFFYLIVARRLKLTGYSETRNVIKEYAASASPMFMK